jgi:uncharacterized protein
MAVRPPTTLGDNGAITASAAALYVGEVMHARLKPVGHRFSYRVASLMIDLDRLDEADQSARLFSVGRFNLFGFHEADHGPGDGSSLRAHVDRLLAEAGVARAERIVLLCYPRVLGYVFNPLSVYWALDGAGRTTAVVYEVRNTFGERHTYVAPVRPGEVTAAGLRQTRAKRFYVSPFMPMDQVYHFRLTPPGEGVRVRILETDADGPTLSATFVGRRRPLSDRTLAAVAAAMPLHTVKVVAGIHWEALRLWLKGAPYFPHRAPHGDVTSKTPREVLIRPRNS